MNFRTVQPDFNGSAIGSCKLISPVIRTYFDALIKTNADMPIDKDNPIVRDIHNLMAQAMKTVYDPPQIKQMTTEQLIRMRYDFDILSDNFIRYFYKNPVPKSDVKNLEHFWKLAIQQAPYTMNDFKKAEKLLSAVLAFRVYETLPFWESTYRWDLFVQAQLNFSTVFMPHEQSRKIKDYTGYSVAEVATKKAILWGHDFLRTLCVGRG